jgi:hypothetical protein
MRIDAAPADHVATGRRQRDLAEAGDHRSGEQDRRANFLAQRRIERSRLGVTGVEDDGIRAVPLHRRSHVLQEREHGLDVANPGNVVDAAGTISEERCRENRESRVLVAGGADRAVEWASPRDTERRWHRRPSYRGACV